MSGKAKDERVPIFVPRGNANDEQQIVIGFNAVNYVLPKGKTSYVPREVAMEYERAMAAEEKAFRRAEEMIQK